jgi:hypothetical protein
MEQGGATRNGKRGHSIVRQLFLYDGTISPLLADRYDEAASWAAKAINEQPNWPMPLRVAAIAYALSDRIVEPRGGDGPAARVRSHTAAVQS